MTIPSVTGQTTPLPTRDPFTGGPLLVTRLQNPESGTEFIGRFSLGWVGRLTPEQLDFVGLLIARRANLQKLAVDLGIAYNTARNRLEEIVRALGGGGEEPPAAGGKDDPAARREVLRRVAAGELDAKSAKRELQDLRAVRADAEGD